MSTPPSSDAPPEPTGPGNPSGAQDSRRDSNQIAIGERANAKQVAAGTNITQNYYEAEAAYDVHGCDNPYIGLAAFTYAERAKYAGRKKLITETVERITAPSAPIPLLFVTGASGSGKSSFAQAGLLPALESFYGEFTVKHAVMRPAGDPFAALNDALWRQLRISETSQVSRAAPQRTNLRGLEDTPLSQINLLVLDQFEEFFTQSSQAAREAFFAWLANLPSFAKTRTHIIATMRADYLPELFNHPGLYDIAKRGVDLRAMTAQELSEAIQQPLRASPYADTKRFEPSLVEKLAEDAAQDAAYLPLLQVTLQELWRKGSLKRADYTNLTDAIKQRADQVLKFQDYDAANPKVERKDAEQTALLNLMLDLVDVSPDDDAHRDVRRQRAKADLTRGDPNRERWVQQLSDARLLSVQQDAQEGSRTEVDLIHETLLTNWTRLQSEIANRRTELRRRARFEQNLDEWLTQKRSDDYLLEGVRLAEARELEAHDDVALRSDDAKAYLRASVARVEAEQQAELERERQRAEALKQRARILRFAIFGVSALALLALVTACFAVQQQGEAVNKENQRATAEAQALARAEVAQTAQAAGIAQAKTANQAKETAQAESLISSSKSLAAQSVSNRDQDLGLAYLHGIQGFKQSETFEARRNLFDLRYKDLHRKTLLWGHTNSVWSVAFSPDGQTLASGSCAEFANSGFCNSGEILLWDVATQQRVGEFTGHTYSVRSVAFSPDGETLASGSADRTILLWDVATQQRVGEFTGHTSAVNSVAFSPDGQTLASGSEDNSILLWDVGSQSWLIVACRIVNRNLTRAEYGKYISREVGAYVAEYADDPTCAGLPIEPLPTPTPTMTPPRTVTFTPTLTPTLTLTP